MNFDCDYCGTYCAENGTVSVLPRPDDDRRLLVQQANSGEVRVAVGSIGDVIDAISRKNPTAKYSAPIADGLSKEFFDGEVRTSFAKRVLGNLEPEKAA